MTIDILLATYNGEKYIASQIYSLLAQSYQDWILYVADDCSTDDTLNIIRTIMQNDDRLKIMEFEQPVRNAAKNFWRLLSYSTSEYIIFCDQDDIWLETKLENLLTEAQEKFDPNMPCLVYCDTYIYDDNKKLITANTLYPITFNIFEEFIFHNGGYQGSCILFNKKLINKALLYDFEYMYIHDEIVSLIAHCFGKVYFLPQPSMLYRIHENNVIGNKDIKYNKWIKRLKNLLYRNDFVIYRKSFKSKQCYFNYFKNSLAESERKIFEQYFDYCDAKFFQRIIISLTGRMTKFRMYLFYRTLAKKLFDE